MLKNNGGRIKTACMTAAAGDCRSLSVLHKERAKRKPQIHRFVCESAAPIFLLIVPE